MGLITAAVGVLASARPLYSLLTQSRRTVEQLTGDDLEIPFLDFVIQAVIKAKEYRDAYGGSGAQARAKATSDVLAMIDRINKKRGFEIQDRAAHEEKVERWVGLTYDIYENMKADDDKIAPKD